MTAPYTVPADATVSARRRSLVRSAVTRALKNRGHEILGRTSAELDLQDRDAVDAFFDARRPTHVLLGAGASGGILANSTALADFCRTTCGSSPRSWTPGPAATYARPHRVNCESARPIRLVVAVSVPVHEQRP